MQLSAINALGQDTHGETKEGSAAEGTTAPTTSTRTPTDNEEACIRGAFADDARPAVAACFASFCRVVVTAAAEVVRGGGDFTAADLEKLRQCRFGGDNGAAFFHLLAESISQQQVLKTNAQSVSTKAKDAGEFKFGSSDDFVAGLQGMIGSPKGVNEDQWLEAMEDEHTEVDVGLWGGSAREWTTGNYLLSATPEKEWRWAYRCEWNGVVAEKTAGGYEEVSRGGRTTGFPKFKSSTAAEGAFHPNAAGRSR